MALDYTSVLFLIVENGQSQGRYGTSPHSLWKSCCHYLKKTMVKRLRSPAVMCALTRQVNKVGPGLSIHSGTRKADTMTFSEPAYLSNFLVVVVCPAGPLLSFALRPTPSLCPDHNPPALIAAGILAL